MRRDLLELVMEHDELAELDPASRRLALRALLLEVSEGDVSSVLSELCDEVDGLGPLSSLMQQAGVTDVLVNGCSEVWVERHGRLERTQARFEGARALRAFIDRVLGAVGAQADASNPVADARLRDGSRIHVVLPPIAPDGPLISIRRFPERAPSLGQLVARGMLRRPEARLLAGLVVDRKTLSISGATGSGKTTLLNALLAEVPVTERVVLIEETPELKPSGPQCVSLVARRPNLEGAGGIDLAYLVRAALRMRPDRIIVGEVRGPEALAALAAMSTGHAG
jgi:pilus assembly protein CpaF